jgi:ABC-type Fe3+/spermidine/putrescine transport system ATPase subunit
MKGMSKVDRRAPVERALRQVNLAEYGDRRPRQLSGGQQQRVALARAIVTEPRLLLLDEPLSSLDHRIRLQLRAELRRLQRALGLTGVYVTHDHSEALALGDRIAVMRDGAVVEYGTPRQVFSRPRTRYAAEFLGVGNVIEVTRVTRTGDRVRCATALGEVEVAAPGTEEDVDAICLGHTDLRITSWPEAADREASPEGWAGTVVGLEYEKGGVAVAVELVDSGQSLTAFVPGSTELSISDKVSVQADWSAAFPLTRP